MVSRGEHGLQRIPPTGDLAPRCTQLMVQIHTSAWPICRVRVSLGSYALNNGSKMSDSYPLFSQAKETRERSN